MRVGRMPSIRIVHGARFVIKIVWTRHCIRCICNFFGFYLQMENLTVLDYDNGIGKCPFNPTSNITTLMTTNGKMFVGSPTDFSSSDVAIVRQDVRQGLVSIEVDVFRHGMII